MTTPTNLSTPSDGCAEPIAYLDFAGRIDWFESGYGASAGADRWEAPIQFSHDGPTAHWPT